MFTKAARLRCAGSGPNVTARDHWLSVGVALGVTIGITMLWMRLRVLYPGNPYVHSFSLMAYSFAYLVTLPFTSLKGRSRRTQLIMIGGMTLILVPVWFLVTILLNARH